MLLSMAARPSNTPGPSRRSPYQMESPPSRWWLTARKAARDKREPLPREGRSIAVSQLPPVRLSTSTSADRVRTTRQRPLAGTAAAPVVRPAVATTAGEVAAAHRTFEWAVPASVTVSSLPEEQVAAEPTVTAVAAFTAGPVGAPLGATVRRARGAAMPVVMEAPKTPVVKREPGHAQTATQPTAPWARAATATPVVAAAGAPAAAVAAAATTAAVAVGAELAAGGLAMPAQAPPTPPTPKVSAQATAKSNSSGNFHAATVRRPCTVAVRLSPLAPRPSPFPFPPSSESRIIARHHSGGLHAPHCIYPRHYHPAPLLLQRRFSDFGRFPRHNRYHCRGRCD